LDYSDRFKNITFDVPKLICEDALKRYPKCTLNETINQCFLSSQTIIIKNYVGKIKGRKRASLNLNPKLHIMDQLIPESITHIITYVPLTKFIIPNRITYLNINYNPIGTIFNCAKHIPLSVTHLTFGNDFESSIINIPSHLKYLKINDLGFFHILKLEKIPTLEYLSINHVFETHEIYPLVKTLKIIHGRDRINIKKSFPNVTHLTFYSLYFIYLINIPQTVTHLSFGKNFNYQVGDIPHHVTHLKFGHNFNRKISIHPECVSVIFGKTFNKPIKPESLGHLDYLKLSSEYKFMDDIRQFFKGRLDIY
jgi:hypothetical protein